MAILLKERPLLPGFGLSLGLTLAWLGLIVLIPLAMLAVKASDLDWHRFVHVVTSPRVLASYRLSFGAALVAALFNAVLGTVVAWVLVRYRFPGRRLVDTLIDLPFALPTAVAGITLTMLLTRDGWVGRLVAPFGIDLAFTPLGVTIALTFIGLPFVVRAVQPVLAELDGEAEEAASSLGAGRVRTFCAVILPELWPAILAGFSMALARGVGEYGSVVFIAGNLPMKTEITPLLIITRLEEYDYAGATAIALTMLGVSLLLLLGIAGLERLRLRRKL